MRIKLKFFGHLAYSLFTMLRMLFQLMDKETAHVKNKISYLLVTPV
jgi:hypothetical protein